MHAQSDPAAQQHLTHYDHWLNWFGSHTPDWLDQRVHSSGIHNFLTHRTFTPFQLQFLSNGLRFICTPPKTHLPQFIHEFIDDHGRGWKRFIRSLTQRILYQDKQQDDRNNLQRFHLPKSSMNDNYLHRLETDNRALMADELQWLDRYSQLTLQLLTKVVTHPHTAQHVEYSVSNHSAADRRFLNELLLDRSITIKPADKNLGLAFVDTSWYNSELKRMLSDTITYQRCQPTFTQQGKQIPFSVDKLKDSLLSQLRKLAARHSATLEEWFPEYGKQLTTFLTDKVSKASSSIPNIYLLIKVHKPKGLCGRPIVPCTKWLTTPASVLADFLLQDIVKQAQIPWIVKDTKSLIVDIESSPLSMRAGIFVTADIASLYTNIDTKLGLELIRKFLLEQKVAHDRIMLIMQLLELVMNNAYLSFRQTLYHQIDGTAMGTAAAPIYANIIVYMLERDLVTEFQQRGVLHFYRRYLDDIFAFIEASAAAEFIRRMNELHKKLVFEFVTDPNEASFLDLLLFKGKRFQAEGIFDMRVHQKKMNLYLYIPFDSHHTPAAKRSFIQTELMRYIRNSSDMQDYLQLKQLFFQRLRARGYPSLFLEPVFNSIYYIDRPYFLHPSSSLLTHPLLLTQPPMSLCLQKSLQKARDIHSQLQHHQPTLPLVFVIPYNPLSALVPTRRILTQYWEVLAHSFRTDAPFPPIIAYQAAPSLGRMLVHAKEKIQTIKALETSKESTIIRFLTRPTNG